jgi:deoxyribonuclease (pyrimidine dimer)
MTRINVIEPSRLSDQHLGAEYRELPRVFGLVRDAIARGERPTDPRNPDQYVLGAGHVRFFYPRLDYLLERYLKLCEECRKRGRAVNFGNPTDLITGIPADWFGYWTPDAHAEALDIDRINQRGGLRPNL